MLRPPQHRADAPIVFVHPRDGAWDNERLKRELAAMKAEGRPESQHPVLRYQAGHTRFDIAEVRDYVGEDATLWYFKRLDAFSWQDVEAMREAQVNRGSKPRTAYLRALGLALVRVEKGPILAGEQGKWTAEDIEQIAALSFYDEESRETVDVLYDVGQAAYTASMPLSKAEKKA